MTERHWALLRIAMAATLVAAGWAAVQSRLEPRGAWPPGEAELRAMAARRSEDAEALTAAWRGQLSRLEAPLERLRLALAVEGREEVRRRVAARALEWLDSGRREAELRAMAALEPEALKLDCERNLRAVVAGSAAGAAEIGAALAEIAAVRSLDRAPHRVLDAFGERLLDWLTEKG